MSRRTTAVVFAPYLHTLGGGERVIVRAAELVAERMPVRLGAPRPIDMDRWRRLGFPDGWQVEPMNARQFSAASLGAPLAVTITNHLPLPSLARRSMLFVQFPNDRLDTLPAPRRLAHRWALGRFDVVLANSSFTADHVRERWGRPADVVPQPVRRVASNDDVEQPVILSVGRFGSTANAKRQDVLLEAWARLAPQLPDWRLVLVGAATPGDPLLEQLRGRAADVRGVEIHVDVRPEELDEHYRSAAIYWHAAGFGRPADQPGAAEHFGMTTVEAMSAGAVPVVFPDGGQTELVPPEVGAQWHTVDELVEVTAELAHDVVRRRRLADTARRRAAAHGPDQFDDFVRGQLEELLR